jgi:5-methylcytosine-specific restriction protein A
MPIRPPTFGARPDVQRQAYDRDRGSASARGYGRRWQKVRLAFLRAHPLCQCEQGCQRVATEVDHIKPHGGDQTLMWDWANFQALTKECHARKTRNEQPRGRG